MTKRTRETKNNAESYADKHRKIFDELIQTFVDFDNADTVESKQRANGIIASCILMGCSERTLKSVLQIGQGRYRRGARDKPGGANGNALTADDLRRMKDDLKTWKLEYGYPCNCRKIKAYFVEQNLTWRMIWQKYREKMIRGNFRVISEARWKEYRLKIAPNLALDRVQEDMCDTCFRLNEIVNDENSSEAERIEAQLALDVHKSVSREQRFAYHAIIQQSIQKNTPNKLPDILFPTNVDDPAVIRINNHGNC